MSAEEQSWFLEEWKIKHNQRFLSLSHAIKFYIFYKSEN